MQTHTFFRFWEFLSSKTTSSNYAADRLMFFVSMLFFGLFFQTTQAQNPEKFDFKYVEQKSYKLYSTGQWEKLISFGKEAINRGHDYYYLRLRLGLAYFNENNYFLAACHLEKAHRLNASDPTPISYLYFSYVYSKRNLAADALLREYPGILNEILADKHPYNNQLYFESGPIFSDNITNNKKKNPAGKNGILGIQDMNGDKTYGHFGWKGMPAKNISLYAGIDFLNTSKLQNIQTSEWVKTGYDTILSNGWYYVDTLYGRIFETREYPYQLRQRSIYAQARINLGKGYSLIPAARLLFVNYTSHLVEDTLVYYYAQSYDTLQSATTRFSIVENKTRFTNYVFSLGISKYYRNFEYTIFGSYSKLNYQQQYQAGAGINWYPLGNLNLYSRSQGLVHFESNKTSYLFDQLIGFKLSNKLWIEGILSLGQLDNLSLDNAFVVYNSGDEIQLRTGANFIIPLSKRFELSVRYQYLKLHGIDEWYDENMEYNTIETKYNNNLIIGGIQWKF